MLTLRRFNNILSIILATVVVYFLVAPFLGNFTLFFHKNVQHKDGYVYQTKLQKKSKPTKPIPKDSRLVIPGMLFDGAINEGTSVYTLNKGIWHQPNTGDPVHGGNMVMLGHRFTYAGPAILYHLDEVKVGDKMIIYWEQKEYDYEVKAINVVSPRDMSLVQPTDKPQVTLYTCTPLWTAKNRLVITAVPTKGDN